MPINYASYFQGIQNPIESAMQGYQIGLSGSQERERIKLQQLKAQELEKQKAAALSLQKELYSVSQIEDPQKKLKSTYDLIMRNPSLAEHMKVVTQPLSEEVKQANAAKALSVFTALQTGNNDQAKEMLKTNKEVAINSGNEEEATMMQGLIDMIDSGNVDAAKTGSALYSSFVLGPEKTVENYAKIQEELRKQQREGFELKKIEKELADMESGKIPQTPEKKFEAENNLRKEYATQTKDFSTIQDSYRRIEAVEPTPAGDMALIFNYMKMLDPGSVVRESEYATAQNASGVPDLIRRQYNQILSGEKLSDSQRKDFIKQSKNLMESSKIKEKSVREKLVKIAGQYGLNKENIFYTDPEKTEEIQQNQGRNPLPAEIQNRSYMRFVK